MARALYGDANLDGTVDVEDFNRVLLNHDPSRAVWSWGDFNYDGQVNSVDLSMMLANYGQTLLPLGGGLLLSVDNIWRGESGEAWGIHMNWSLEHYPTVGENAVFPRELGGMVHVNLDAYADRVVFEGDYTLYSSSSSTLTFNEMYVGTDKEVVISDLELIGEGNIYSSGFLTLTGNSTYYGDMYVYEGELRVTDWIANSEITVQNDAILSGTGTTGDVTVIDNGVLSPGEGSIGILSTRNLTFGPSYYNPHFEVDVWSDEDYDQVYVEWTVNILGNANLDIVSNLQESGDEVLVLIKIDEYDSIGGTFFDFELDFELEEGATVFVGDAPYTITYRYNAEEGQFGNGNDVALRPPPVFDAVEEDILYDLDEDVSVGTAFFTLGQELGQLHAVDPSGGTVAYSGEQSSYFSVDESTGVISIDNPSGLAQHFQTAASITLEVYASNGVINQTVGQFTLNMAWHWIPQLYIDLTDTANNHYTPTTATQLIANLNTIRTNGDQVNVLIIKGHGWTNAIRVGIGDNWLTTPSGQIWIGTTDVTQLLKDVTDNNSTIKLRGCHSLPLAGSVQSALDGATVYGARGFIIGIPGTPWGWGWYQ